jgi:hypothetical protein
MTLPSGKSTIAALAAAFLQVKVRTSQHAVQEQILILPVTLPVHGLLNWSTYLFKDKAL